MFEKESKEYANNWLEHVKDLELQHKSDDKPEYIRILEAHQKGAEFGYNKANEWHYVKDELPPENVPLNIITLDKNKKRRLWVGEYKGGNGEYWSGYFNHFIDVPYAWKEIVLPELKESE